MALHDAVTAICVFHWTAISKPCFAAEVAYRLKTLSVKVLPDVRGVPRNLKGKGGRYLKPSSFPPKVKERT